jgi:hypothetical protein
MMSLAIAMPSTSSSARSAPKMRSALSALLAQSGGSSCVSVLMMRRFWSAAVVRREAFQSQSATMMTNARTSAVALNAPRPAHLARKIACRFTSGERLCAGVSPSPRGYAEGRCGPSRSSRRLSGHASRARSHASSSALGSQRTLRWRKPDSNSQSRVTRPRSQDRLTSPLLIAANEKQCKVTGHRGVPCIGNSKCKKA